MNLKDSQIQEVNKYTTKKGYKPTTKEKIYILGPMTGIKNHNFEEFFKAEEYLKSLGYFVINPARNIIGLTARDYLQIDIQYVFAADAVYCLKGYKESNGAMVEYSLAKYLGLRISYEEG